MSPRGSSVENASVIDVYNADLVAEIIRLNMRLYSFNHTIASLEPIYAPIRTGFVADQIDERHYKANAEQFCNQCGALSEILNGIDVQITTTLDKLHYLGDRDRPLRMFRWTTGWYLRSPKVTDEEMRKARPPEKPASRPS